MQRRDSAEKYIFSDTKDLDENRWFQDPDGSRNPGTNGLSDPGVGGAGINFINDKIIIRRIATLLVSGPDWLQPGRAPS